MKIDISQSKLISKNHFLLIQILNVFKKPINPRTIHCIFFLLKKKENNLNYNFHRKYSLPHSDQLEWDLNYLIGIGILKQETKFWTKQIVIKINHKKIIKIEPYGYNDNIKNIFNSIKEKGLIKFYYQIFKDYKIENYAGGNPLD